jgi:membrane-associated protease RseP (regulator of RpoE activity)
MRSVLLATGLAALAVAAEPNAYQQVADEQQRPILGVEMTPIPTHVLDREGLSPDQGVQVQQVYSGTAASDMGLRRDDIILAVNDAPIGSMTDLRNEVGLNQVGDPVTVAVLRDGRTLELGAGLKPWPEQIPYKPLDAAAERRFREWQDRRNGRLAKEAQELRRQIEAVRRQLSDDPSDAVGPGDGMADAGRGLPAFRLTLQIPAAGAIATVAADPQPEPVADSTGLLADPAGAGRPWTATVTVAL